MIFGPNMTSLNFTLSRTAGREFAAGDEILVSSLDHDGGVAPWLELAHDRDLVVRHIELLDDTTLDYDDLDRSSARGPGSWRSRGRRTRSGPWSTPSGYASSRTTPARSPGSTRSTTPRTSRSTFAQIGADVLICSPYKFCGPHLGMAYGRAELIERVAAVQGPARADATPLGRRFETGTQPYELLAGFNATFDYLDSIGGFEAIVPVRARARASGSLPGSPTRCPSTGCRRWRAACRRS